MDCAGCLFFFHSVQVHASPGAGTCSDAHLQDVNSEINSRHRDPLTGRPHPNTKYTSSLSFTHINTRTHWPNTYIKADGCYRTVVSSNGSVGGSSQPAEWGPHPTHTRPRCTFSLLLLMCILSFQDYATPCTHNKSLQSFPKASLRVIQVVTNSTELS